MYNKAILFLLLLASLRLSAQNDLLESLQEETIESTEYAIATFKGTQVINLQSPEMPSEGVLQYIFAHRFGAFNDDFFYNNMGLNTAEVSLRLDYGIKDWLNAGLGLSTATPRTYFGFVKYRMLRQSKGAKNSPISLVGYSSIFYNNERYSDTLPHNNSERVSFVNQLVIARKFNSNFSLELVPTWVHFNVVNLQSEDNDLFSIGAAARYKITNQVAITAEYIYQLNPLETNLQSSWPEFQYQTNENVFSLGVDIETGGHVFQIFLSNSSGVADPYTIAQSTGSWADGAIHLGFNISRVFTIYRPKQPNGVY